jgi:hypothetical protein
MSSSDDDRASLLRSHPGAAVASSSLSCPSPRASASHRHADVEAADEAAAVAAASPRRVGGVRGLLRHLDRRVASRGSARRHQHQPQQPDRAPEQPSAALSQQQQQREELGDGAPPEWALLLIGCLLGLATGICVAAFNRGVSAVALRN